MKKSKLGRLISQGKTSKEIRARIKDFPVNPTAEYFTSLGYKSSTAKTYMSKLKKNGEVRKQQPIIALKEQNKIRKNADEKNFIKSKNADENNLLLDTCALKSELCVSIIEESENVNALLVTIDEFDSIIQRYKFGEKFDEDFIYNIIKFSRKFLEDKRYVLASYEYNETKYVDKVIINYVLSLPIEKRPTLITADIRLAARAKCCGIEYILYMKPLDKEIKLKSQPRRITDFGICIEVYEDNLIMQSSREDIKCFIVDGNQCIEINELEKVDTSRKYTLFLLKNNPVSKKVKVLKIDVKKQRMLRNRIDFKNIDEISESDINPIILDEIRKVI